MNTHIDTVIGAMSMRNELHGIAHSVRHGQIDRRNTADAFGVDTVSYTHLDVYKRQLLLEPR